MPSAPDDTTALTAAAFAARGRTAWWSYPLVFTVAIPLWMLLVSAIVAALMALGRLPPDLARELTTPTQPTVFFPATGVIFGLLLAAFILAARLVQAKRFGDIVGAWNWRRFGAGAAIWTAIQTLSVLLDYLISPHGFSITATGSTGLLAATALVGLGAQTFAEEWVFRGWLTQGLLLATRRPLAAAILSGLMFGAIHIPNGLPQATGATAFGIAAALIAIRTGGIAFTSGLHLVNNLFGAVVVVSADDVFRGGAGLFSQHTTGLMWWDVGVEIAGLAAVVLLLGRRPPAREA